MKKLLATPRVAFHAVLVAAIVTSGCGGAFSGNDDPAPSNASGGGQAGSGNGSNSGNSSGSNSTPAAPTAEILANPSFESTTGWALRDSSLVSNNQWADGKALKVSSWITQALPANKLQPGKSYTLRVKARNEKGSGTAALAVNFRLANGERLRNYRKAYEAGGTGVQEFTLDFTAPAYATNAEIAVSATDTTLSVDSVSLKQRATLDPTEPIASKANSYVPAGYKLAFNDEFNGSTLNRDKWYTRYIYAGGTMDRLNDERQRYRDNDNHRVANGVLSLISRKVTNNDTWGIDWESGMIRSDWTTRYGYFEARVKMPGGLGVWPAFWLSSDASPAGKLGWPPEIDIFEFVNNGVEDKVNMIHSGVVRRGSVMPPTVLLQSDPTWNNQWTFWRAPFNFTDDWHTIAGEWTEDKYTMYVDGKQIYSRTYKWTLEDGSQAGPAHVLLNLAVGGQWAGRHGVDVSQQEFLVDWVRVYKKN